MGNGGNQLAAKMGQLHGLAVAAMPVVSVAIVASRFFPIAGHLCLPATVAYR
jgi:hypothetical protein